MYKLAQEIADGLTVDEMQSLQSAKWGKEPLTIEQQAPLISLRLLEKPTPSVVLELTPLGNYVLGLIALEDRKPRNQAVA